MADESEPSRSGDRHPDASGQSDQVYCHSCNNTFPHDEHGLICPRCDGDITEIVSPPSKQGRLRSSLILPQITPESDPRTEHESPQTPPELHDLRRHYPWRRSSNDTDPEEADIEEHVTHGPGGSVFFSQTIRSSRPPNIPFGTRPRRRDQFPEEDPDHVMTDFQNMLGTLMGPALRPGQTGRSGPDTLFTQNHTAFGPNTFHTTTRGPNVVGGRFTFTTGPLRPRDADGPQPGDSPVGDLNAYALPQISPNGRLLVVSIRAPSDHLPRILGSLLGAMHPPGEHDQDPNARGMPSPFGGLLASLLNPANARHGDAVYSQEALDSIISTLMEQHPTSNAPGPASPEAISSLPKKSIDEQMLGTEGKAECSVCMDEVHIGDEVVSLPCKHWFHEQCATMWLSEHNTCPICRKGIEGDSPPSASRRSSNGGNQSPRTERRSSRISLNRPSLSRRNTSSRNEARLDAIRHSGRLSPTNEDRGPTNQGSSSTRRWRVVGTDDSDPSREMPGSFSRYRGERDEGRRESASRGHASGRDSTSASVHPRRSRSPESSGGGPMSWLRDRFGSGRRNHD